MSDPNDTSTSAIEQDADNEGHFASGTDRETNLDGYVWMGCVQCTNEVLYPEDNRFVPVCAPCDLRMQEFPIEETTTPQDRSVDTDTDREGSDD